MAKPPTTPDRSAPGDGARAVGSAATGPRWSARQARAVVVAILVGALAATTLLWVRGEFDDDPGDLREATVPVEPKLAASEFRASVAGDCLTWPGSDPSVATRIDCAAPHKFEVAGSIEPPAPPSSSAPTSAETDPSGANSPLAPIPVIDPTNPASILAADAPYPLPAQMEILRDTVCPAQLNGYLGHPLDPTGRFQMSILYSNVAGWDEGDRVVRCGLQSIGADGFAAQLSGSVRTLEQSVVYELGECAGIDGAGLPTSLVPCVEPHAFEVTAVIDLTDAFGGPGTVWPGVDAQNEHLNTACIAATDTRYENPDTFYFSALNMNWTVVSEAAWAAGDRRVDCYGALPAAPGVFTVLTGVIGVDLLIAGQQPAQTPRPPEGRYVPPPVG